MSSIYSNANQEISSQNITGANYGLRAYQQGTRSPYLTSEMQRPRPVATPSPAVNLQQINQNMNVKPAQPNLAQGLAQGQPMTMQKTIQQAGQRPAPTATRPKTSNIDSMKFLESMTKIYEKNGRPDLAQGLKTNMKKAKMNMS